VLGEKFLVSGGADKTVIVWDATSAKQFALLSGHTDRISCLHSDDSSEVMSGSYDKTLINWDIERSVQKTRLKGHTGSVTFVDALWEKQM